MNITNENVINLIIKSVEEEAILNSNIQVSFTPDELNAVNTVLHHVYNNFVDMDNEGQELSLEVNKFIDDLYAAYKKVNNAD